MCYSNQGSCAEKEVAVEVEVEVGERTAHTGCVTCAWSRDEPG